MSIETLAETARAMVAPGKGILAIDESTSTISRRFESVGIASNEANRRATEWLEQRLAELRRNLQVAEEAVAALPLHWAKMTELRVGFSRTVLTGGKTGDIILTSSVEESYDFVNAYAPEHLEILSKEPYDHLGKITEAS